MPSKVKVEGKAVRFIRKGTSIVYRKWTKPKHSIPPGALVELESSRGETLACGLWEPEGPVAVRILGRGECEWDNPADAINNLIEKAYNARKKYRRILGKSYRLVNSDGDRLSGLIIDIYNEELAVLQSSSMAIDFHIKSIVEALVEIVGVNSIYEKSIQRSRRDIGLEPRKRWLKGKKPRIIIEEEGARFIVDVVRGQKTGFYLDQRLNRLEFSRLASTSDRILDIFSYTGGFGIHAALNGVREVVFIEEDPVAVEILKENLKLNNINNYKIINNSIWKVGELPKNYYTLIAVDPPAFIQSGDKISIEKGLKAYKNVYKWSLERASPNSIVYLSSCSYFLTKDLFLEAISSAAEATGREYRIMGSLRGAGPDHSLRAEEYLDYLKGAFINIL